MKVSILLTVLLFAGLEGVRAAKLVPGSGHSTAPPATAAVKIDKGEETKFDQPSSHADHERNQPPVYYPSSSAAEPLHFSETEASYDEVAKDNCKAYYETELRQKCVHYTDQVCSTTHKEFCKDVERKSCHGVVAVTGDSVRRCVNVTELHCGLVETVQYEMVTASYTVQKCHMVTERVCDTVYEVQTSEDTQEDVQCVQVPSYSCHHVEKTVYDRVCRHQTKHHDCDQSECETQTEVSCQDTPKVVKVLDCSDGEEQVCAKVEAQQLVPECDDVTTRRTCDYIPVDSCEEVPQSHCFTVPQKVLKYDCQQNHHPEPSQTTQY